MKCSNCNGTGWCIPVDDKGDDPAYRCPACGGTGRVSPDDDWTGRNMRKPNRIIVAGSRGFDDYALLDRKLNYILQRLAPENTVIVSGTARGADVMGEHWAWAHGFEVLRFPADWEKHGRRAGMIRNEKMAAIATHLVAFWDQKSHGTFNMIQEARARGLKVIVVRY